jgi:hypothetical protein
LNFGSVYLSGGYKTWPVEKSIPSNLKALATEIFAFDALIQNPDRRSDKPNILWKSDEIFIIDHEMGFSFVYSILQSKEPWKVSEIDFLRKHLFYNKLKGQTLNFDRFAGVLETLAKDGIESILNMVPEEWKTPKIESIGNHLAAICGHVDAFIDEIRRVLV